MAPERGSFGRSAVEIRATPERRVYRFGLFEADLEQGTLKRQGAAVKLQEQPFRVLALLLEARGQLLTREELRRKIWPEGTFVEFGGCMNTALMKLRAALNDSADNPVFIETVPRQGYRFIAPVELLAENPTIMTAIRIESNEDVLEGLDTRTHEEKKPPEKQSGETRLAERWWEALAILAGLAVLLTYGMWPRPEPRVQAVQQLTHSGQVDPWGKLVTDGSRIYFVGRDVTGWNLMQTSVEGGSIQRTPTPFDNTRIFDLSPDHSQFLIGQLTHRGEETALWLWPVQGGAPRRLGDVTAQEAVWSPTGNQIEGTDSMCEIGADRSSLRQVLPEGQRGPHEGSGTWLAGGRYFAFSSGVDLRASLAVDTHASLWVMEENRGLFRSRSGDPVQLTRGPIAFDHPTAIGDGSRIFAIGSHNEYQLLRMDPRTLAKTAMLAESGATDMDFSLDGQWVVYAARENGTLEKGQIEGNNRVQLTPGAPGPFPQHWSPDQKEILFTGFLLDRQPRLYVVSAQGGAPRSVLPSDNKWASVSGDWRTDGRQIVLDVQEIESGRDPNIRIFDLESGKLATLPDSEGLLEPRWSADGRYIAALNPKKKQVFLYDCKFETWSVLAEANFPSALRWSPAGDALYYQDTDDVEEAIFRVPMAKREAERVVRLGDLLSTGAARAIFTGLSPDGSLYVTADHGDVDVYAVDLKLP